MAAVRTQISRGIHTLQATCGRGASEATLYVLATEEALRTAPLEKEGSILTTETI